MALQFHSANSAREIAQPYCLWGLLGFQPCSGGHGQALRVEQMLSAKAARQAALEAEKGVAEVFREWNRPAQQPDGHIPKEQALGYFSEIGQTLSKCLIKENYR